MKKKQRQLITRIDRDVLAATAAGYRIDPAAKLLGLTPGTVYERLRALRKRFKVKTVTELIVAWSNNGEVKVRYQHIGRVFIEAHTPRDEHLEILRGCIVLRCEFMAARGGFEYDIDHPCLPEAITGRMPPEVLCVFRSGKLGPRRIAFQDVRTGELFYTDAREERKAEEEEGDDGLRNYVGGAARPHLTGPVRETET